jgi:hypothetical protein
VNFMVPVPLGAGQRLPKIDQFSKIFSTTAHVEEKLNASTKIVKFIIFGAADLPLGQGQI